MIKKTILVLVILLCFTSTALAEDLTIEDAIAVSEQIKEYRVEILVLASVAYNEARGIDSQMEQSAVCWTVLNRVDSELYPNDIIEVCTAPHQFAYERMTIPNDECKEIARDVVFRWLLEKRGIEEVGRVLPKEYLFFAGRNGHNYFRKEYASRDYWDWSLADPYEREED